MNTKNLCNKYLEKMNLTIGKWSFSEFNVKKIVAQSSLVDSTVWFRKRYVDLPIKFPVGPMHLRLFSAVKTGKKYN